MHIIKLTKVYRTCTGHQWQLYRAATLISICRLHNVHKIFVHEHGHEQYTVTGMHMHVLVHLCVHTCTYSYPIPAKITNISVHCMRTLWGKRVKVNFRRGEKHSKRCWHRPDYLSSAAAVVYRWRHVRHHRRRPRPTWLDRISAHDNRSPDNTRCLLRHDVILTCDRAMTLYDDVTLDDVNSTGRGGHGTEVGMKNKVQKQW